MNITTYTIEELQQKYRPGTVSKRLLGELKYVLLVRNIWSACRFGIEGGMWDVIVLIPDHCLSIYFPDPSMNQHRKQANHE